MNIDKGIALGKDSTGVETVVFPQSEHTAFSKLTPVGKRKMLRKMQ